MRRVFCLILLLSVVSIHCSKNSQQNGNTPGLSYNHNRNPGNSAADYLGSSTYSSLTIEILYMPGCRPANGALTMFIDLIKERLNKPQGIFLQEKEIDPTLKTVFSYTDISNTETANRTVFTQNTQMSACMLFVDGSYTNPNVLGLAYKNTSICFFNEALQIFSTGSTEDDRNRALAMVFVHEFGHLFGLVDMGTPMLIPHNDPDNGNHCINNVCLMHHTNEPNLQHFNRSISVLPSFDMNCINDMRGNGGK